MLKIKKLLSVILFSCISCCITYAQDLEFDEPAKNPSRKVSAFRYTRSINGQSAKTLGQHTLDVLFKHRFGTVESGAYNLWGLDNAFVRIAFEYGITDNLMAGIGRSSFRKSFDGFIKYRIIQQKQGGDNAFPFSLAWLSTITLPSQAVKEDMDQGRKNSLSFSDNMMYAHQAIISKKFNGIGTSLLPTLVHRNAVPENQNNDVFALGASGRIRISGRMHILAEYFYIPDGQLADNHQPPVALGLDIETGGHHFSLHFTNTLGMNTADFITQTTEDPLALKLRFGFNLSRTFMLKNKLGGKTKTPADD